MQKQVVSKEENGLQFLNFFLENCVLQNKKVFSQSSWPVYTFSVFGRLGFVFQTVLFLVYENMAPLPKR